VTVENDGVNQLISICLEYLMKSSHGDLSHKILVGCTSKPDAFYSASDLLRAWP
jgi:hypothetical protein